MPKHALKERDITGTSSSVEEKRQTITAVFSLFQSKKNIFSLFWLIKARNALTGNSFPAVIIALKSSVS